MPARGPRRGSRHLVEHLAPGSDIGRYVVLERLGAGGMGIVYAAYDPDLDRKVAVKILRPEGPGSGEEAHDRLLREARALARLTHPNVVAVHDVGTFAGSIFIAMTFARGVTLRRWLEGEPRSWRQVLEVFEQAGRGLAAAHAEGLVHRDFKPDNVVISDRGQVRILDFGLARKAEAAATSPEDDGSGSEEDPLAISLTRTGVTLGTPAYMAPEQHLGYPADARSDQFSFCVALYQALYREHPFQGETPMQARSRTLAGEVSPAGAGTDVPARLRQALVRGLRADPDERFPSMEALLEALGRDPARGRRRWLWPSALAGAAALVAILVLAPDDRLCAGGEERWAGVWNEGRRGAARQAFAASGETYAETAWRSVERNVERYGEAWVRMRGEACRATRVHGEQSVELLDLRMHCLDRRLGELDALIELFSRADPKVVENAVPAVEGLRGLDECADAGILTARVKPPADPQSAAAVGELERRLAEVHALWSAGRYEAQLELAKSVVTDAGGVDYPPIQGEAWLARGRAEVLSARYDEAEESLHQALWAALAGGDDPGLARAALELSYLAGPSLLRPAEGHRWARLAAAAIARLDGQAELEAELAYDLAALFYVEGEYERAREKQLEALARFEKLYGRESEQFAGAINDLGMMVHKLGRYEEALGYYRRGLEIDRALFGPDHPRMATGWNNLALGQAEMDDYEGALDSFREALRIHRGQASPAGSEIATVLGNMGVIEARRGRHEEALGYHLRELELREAERPDHPAVGTALQHLGQAYRHLGRLREARVSYERALEIFETAWGSEHPHLAYPLSGLGMTYLAAGEPSRAVAPLERALRLCRQPAGEPRDLAITAFELARALGAAGRDRQRAESLAREALAIYAELEGDFATEQRARIEAWLSGAEPP